MGGFSEVFSRCIRTILVSFALNPAVDFDLLHLDDDFFEASCGIGLLAYLGSSYEPHRLKCR